MGAATAIAGLGMQAGQGILNSFSNIGKEIHNDVFTGMQQAQNYYQTRANLKAQQQAYNYNAKLEDREGVNAQVQTNEQDARLRSEQERIQLSQASLYGKSGTSLYSGSPLAVMAETAGNQELESLELRRQGTIERQRHEQAAEIQRYNARTIETMLDANKKQYSMDKRNWIHGMLGKGIKNILTGGL